MKFKQDKRNYIIAALCLILVIMGVGYAAFSQMLTINGTANITNSWCIGFDNTKTDTMQITKGVSTGTEPTGTMTYSGTACGTNLVPNSSLSARFYQPGDQIEYTLTIVNKSTVTAAIKSILVDNESVTTNTTKKKDNITYIIEMPETTTLAPNASTTMKVIAKFQNETDISGPYSGETKSIEVKINAEQDDENGGMTTTYTGTVYRHNTNRVYNGVNITKSYVYSDSNGSMQNADIFNTLEECQAQYPDNGNNSCKLATNALGSYTEDASTLNKTYYLKHEIVEDVLTNSYVCFVYNNSEHCMKGADSGASFTQNTRIIKDFQNFNSLGAYNSTTKTGCIFTESGSSCFGGGFYDVEVHSNGQSDVMGSSSTVCIVASTGDSRCLF